MKQIATHFKAVSLAAALLAGILMLIAAAGVLLLPAGAEDVYLEKDNSSTLENGYASYIGTINGMARDEALGTDFKQLVTVNDTLTFTGWCIAYNRTVVRYEVKFDDNAWIDAKATLSAYTNPDELKNQFIKDNNFDTEKAVFSLTVDTVGMAEGAHTIAIRAVLSDGSYGLILRKTRKCSGLKRCRSKNPRFSRVFFVFRLFRPSFRNRTGERRSKQCDYNFCKPVGRLHFIPNTQVLRMLYGIRLKMPMCIGAIRSFIRISILSAATR